MLVTDKHSSLLEQFVSYEKNEVPGANQCMCSTQACLRLTHKY
jgi:hypothetical protein